MNPTDRYDSLIHYWFEFFQPQVDKERECAVNWRWIKAMVFAESGFNPRIKSPVGALGLMQVMPKTWGEGWETDWSNPEQNLRVGVKYWWGLWKMFKAETGMERVLFASGAYNCGPGWIIKAQLVLSAKGRATDKWHEIVSVLPQITGESAIETINYVERIRKYYG